MRIIQTTGTINAGVLNAILPKEISNGEVNVIIVSKETPDEFEERHQIMIQKGYDTPDKILDLIHQIKLEMLQEKGRISE